MEDKGVTEFSKFNLFSEKQMSYLILKVDFILMLEENLIVTSSIF
jgi:hypothetical protein